MATKPPTRSKDGEFRYSMRITYRIDLADLVTLVALMLADGHDCPTKQGILVAMRDKLKWSGPWNCGSLDGVDTETRQQAEAFVRPLFPELGSPAADPHEV